MSFLTKIKAVSGAAFAVILIGGGVVSADPADDLQATLAGGSYYIEYENVTPPSPNKTPKEKQRLSQSGSLYYQAEQDFSDPYMAFKIVSGIATADGTNQYSEQSVTDTEKKTDAQEGKELQYTDCSLVRGDEMFKFKRIKDEKGETHYSGIAKNKVSAVPASYNSLGYKNANFGDATMNRLMYALMPNANKAEGEWAFKKVHTGTDANGLWYADYKAERTAVGKKDDVFLNVARYFFNNGKLVKIYSGVYKRENGQVSGTRAIIDVKEFRATPETRLLSLPAEIKDVTKR